MLRWLYNRLFPVVKSGSREANPETGEMAIAAIDAARKDLLAAQARRPQVEALVSHAAAITARNGFGQMIDASMRSVMK